MDNFLAQEFGKSQNYTDIPNRLFKEYNVKKGLRNDDGTGVRVGLTRVSDVVGYKLDENGVKQNAPGELYYRGYKLTDIVNANFDAKDGFEEVMLGVPRDLFTPLFVCARSVGWVAHNIENKLYDGRIMRPATKFVGETLDYVPIRDR